VGILINKNIKDPLLEGKPVSQRIIPAQINPKFRKVTIVQCYAPTENADCDEKEVSYCHLDMTLLDIHRSDILLMGDSNTEVGIDNQDTEDVIWKHKLPQGKENGDLI
jgi:hypothetical protein